MEKEVLIDEGIYPSDTVVSNALGNTFGLYENLVSTVSLLYPKVKGEWIYYKDARSWLGKYSLGSKTLFWLSIWNGFFKVTVFYNQKTIIGLDQDLVEQADKHKKCGKILPIIYSVRDKTTIELALRVLKHKEETLCKSSR